MAKRRRSTGIPGLSFSWKRALGITKAKQQFARTTGIPTTRAGLQRKVGRAAMGGCIIYLIVFLALIALIPIIIAIFLYF